MAKLRQQLPNVRPFSMFGDDNRERIRIQIQVLQEGLDENAIWDRWGEGDSLDDALAALQWRQGLEPEAPSEGWAPLVMGGE